MAILRSDEELVLMIQSGGSDRLSALKQLYLDEKIRASIKALLKGKNETIEFEDILQEAFIIFDRNIRNRRFRGDSAISTYIIGIAKWITLGQWRKRRVNFQTDLLDPDLQREDPMEHLFQDDDRLLMIRHLISRLGARCRSLIRMWSEGESMAAIAVETGVKNAEAAKKEVFRCRERIKKMYHEINPGSI